MTFVMGAAGEIARPSGSIMRMAIGTTSWLRVLSAPPASTRTLVCFPPAGGVANAYREWPKEFQQAPGPDVTVVAVQYPGRQDRFADPLLPTLAALADGAAADLRTAGRVSLFGHSMGATVAYEVARRLGDAVSTLFVSGRPDPSYLESTRYHEVTDAELIDHLELLGNDADLAQTLRQHPELAELVLPTMRSDYRAVETYEWSPAPPLSCDIVALVSDADPTTTPDQAKAWRDYTTAAFTLAEFTGGHFYLDEPTQRAKVCALVKTHADTRIRHL